MFCSIREIYLQRDDDHYNVVRFLLLTTQQHISTIKNPQIAPAVPTTHVNRINKMTPKIF